MTKNYSGPNDSSCKKYDWDYSKLASLGYEGALEFISWSEIKPRQVTCKEHSFSEEVLHSSIVSEVSVSYTHLDVYKRQLD